MMKLITWLFAINIFSIQANLVRMGWFRLEDESKLYPKQRFVFTDHESNSNIKLRNSTIKYDLEFYPQNYEELKNTTNFIRVYVLLMTSE